jgi:hypothetical protein
LEPFFIDEILREINMRQYDPQQRFTVLAWIPAITRIRSLETALDSYLEPLKVELKDRRQLDKDRALQLAQKLTRYQQELEASLDTALPDPNEYIKKDIDDLKLHLPLRKDSSLLTGEIPISLEMLSKLTLDCRLSENYILLYCKKNTVVIIESYEKFAVLAGLNNSHLRAGEPIEVFAGIGHFSLKINPSFKIGGREIKANDETGMALDTLIANNRPGKYKIPVTASFTKPDGTLTTITKNLSYTVDER